jgi:bifunctional DNase/RNase
MEKVELVVLALSASSIPQNSYALILKELEGNRSIPIIIGAFEAQAIALELERSQAPRPMTHDLIKALIYSTNITLTEVLISDLQDGTFFSRLIFENEDIEIDCRPSDAIAIALRCNAPIYINANILDEIGMFSQIENNPNANQVEAFVVKKSKLEQLQSQLDKAINNEDYESAAKIRDEIKTFLNN